jgi:nucleoside-diphosphate-sugar epimerase
LLSWIESERRTPLREPLLVVGAPGSLARALCERLSASGETLELLLAGSDGTGCEIVSGDGVESPRTCRVAEDPLGDATKRLDEGTVGALLLFPWWPGGRFRGRGRRDALVESSLRLIERALAGGARRIVIWTKSTVYEPEPGQPCTESRALVTSGPWAEAADLEERVARLANTSDLPIYRFRSVPVLGAGADAWASAVADARVVPGGNRRTPFQFVDVRDAVGVIERALHGGHPGVFNVAGDGLISWSELCRAVGQVPSPIPVRMARLTFGAGTSRGTAAEVVEQLLRPRVVDPTRLKTHFGYRPRRSGRQALRAACGGAEPGSTPGSAPGRPV